MTFFNPVDHMLFMSKILFPCVVACLQKFFFLISLKYKTVFEELYIHASLIIVWDLKG